MKRSITWRPEVPPAQARASQDSSSPGSEGRYGALNSIRSNRAVSANGVNRSPCTKLILQSVWFVWAFLFEHRIANGFKSTESTSRACFAAIIPRIPVPVPMSSTRAPVLTRRRSANMKESSDGSYTFSQTSRMRSPKKTRLHAECIRNRPKISWCHFPNACTLYGKPSSHLCSLLFIQLQFASNERHQGIIKFFVPLGEEPL